MNNNAPELKFTVNLFYVKSFTEKDKGGLRFFDHITPGSICRGVTIYQKDIINNQEKSTKVCDVLVFDNQDHPPFIFNTGLADKSGSVTYDITLAESVADKVELETEDYLELAKFQGGEEIHSSVKNNIINQTFCRNVLTFLNISSKIESARKFEDLPSIPESPKLDAPDKGTPQEVTIIEADDFDEEFDELIYIDHVIQDLDTISKENSNLFIHLVKIISESAKSYKSK